MAEQKKRRLGDILLEMGMISDADIKRALDRGRSSGLRLGEALIELGIVSEDQILWTLAEQLGLSFIRVAADQVDPGVVNLIPEDMARRHQVLPLIRIGSELTLAVNDPLQDELFADVSRISGCEVLLSLAKSAEINEALDRVYGRESPREEAGAEEMHSDRYSEKELKAFSADKGGAKLLERLVEDCLEEGVNTIHLHVRSGRARVSFRKEGLLRNTISMDAGLGRAMLTRLAIPAGIKVEGEPQVSWRVEISVNNQPVAVEVRRLQVRGGEAAVVRIMGKRAKKIPLSKLGLTPVQRSLVDAILASPGLVVVTGSADSGRATTVMSLLDRFDPSTHLVVTAEDWVRTEHPGHVQVMPGSIDENASRVSALTSLDPDALYLESLRSEEEINAALKGGMAGTFVFTLMGFRRAASVLSYLTGLELQPALVADGVSGIIAQRLVRGLCRKCRVKTTLKKSQVAGLRPEQQKSLSSAPVYTAKGCKACGGTGYTGREAVFEVLAMNQELRQAVASNVPVSKLPLDFGKTHHELPDQVLEKIKKGLIAWTEILAFR